jgi:hypothetical protein
MFNTQFVMVSKRNVCPITATNEAVRALQIITTD